MRKSNKTSQPQAQSSERALSGPNRLENGDGDSYSLQIVKVSMPPLLYYDFARVLDRPFLF
jgi:hypothetical protein